MDMGIPVLRIVPDEPKAEAPADAGGSDGSNQATPVAAGQVTPVLSVVRLEDSKDPVQTNHPSHDDSDGELVGRLLRGERGALERLYRRHAGFAFKLAVRLQGNGHDAEDVVHDAFLKVQSRIASLNDPALFRGWLGSIVVNEVRLRLRRGRLLRALRLQSAEPVELDSLASDAASPEVRAQLAQVYALLRLMATEERIAWTLRFVEHHRLEEVAELTGCSLATVKRRLVGAQRFLAEHLVGDPRQNPGFEDARKGAL
jgi:RNA polymerase sigma-70 factor (ECF subfamily)